MFVGYLFLLVLFIMIFCFCIAGLLFLSPELIFVCVGVVTKSLHAFCCHPYQVVQLDCIENVSRDVHVVETTQYL